MHCPSRGGRREAGDRLCPHCGSRLPDDAAEPDAPGPRARRAAPGAHRRRRLLVAGAAGLLAVATATAAVAWQPWRGGASRMPPQEVLEEGAASFALREGATVALGSGFAASVAPVAVAGEATLRVRTRAPGTPAGDLPLEIPREHELDLELPEGVAAEPEVRLTLPVPAGADLDDLLLLHRPGDE